VAGPIEQFEIKKVFDHEIVINNIDISFTNSALWMVLGAALSIAFLTIGMNRGALVPGRLQMLVELIYDFVGQMVHQNIGKEGKQYFPFIFTLFMFILMGNLLGLVPGSFTYTSHIIVTGFLAVFILVMVIGFGIYNHGTKFFSLFIPTGAPILLMPFIIPIEIISFFVRPVTLSIRLFANMMAGHIVLKIVAAFAVTAASMGAAYVALGVFPVLINVALLLFELLVAVIQAYVFAILSCVYLKDTVELHH